jgi:hypothetical protein
VLLLLFAHCCALKINAPLATTGNTCSEGPECSNHAEVKKGDASKYSNEQEDHEESDESDESDESEQQQWRGLFQMSVCTEWVWRLLAAQCCTKSDHKTTHRSGNKTSEYLSFSVTVVLMQFLS